MSRPATRAESLGSRAAVEHCASPGARRIRRDPISLRDSPYALAGGPRIPEVPPGTPVEVAGDRERIDGLYDTTRGVSKAGHRSRGLGCRRHGGIPDAEFPRRPNLTTRKERERASRDQDWTRPQAVAIPKEGYFELEQGRYGPVFPRTPACHGFTIIARVKPGKEKLFREYGRKLEKTLEGSTYALAPLKLH
jgi:hypothetical protein